MPSANTSHPEPIGARGAASVRAGRRNRVRELRRHRRWTQTLVASKLGITARTFRGVESTSIEPGITLAVRIAELFEKQLDEVFEFYSTRKWQ